MSWGDEYDSQTKTFADFLAPVKSPDSANLTKPSTKPTDSAADDAAESVIQNILDAIDALNANPPDVVQALQELKAAKGKGPGGFTFGSTSVAEDLPGAIDSLKKAIALHKGHMDGSIPANGKTQTELMDLIQGALSDLTGVEEPTSLTASGYLPTQGIVKALTSNPPMINTALMHARYSEAYIQALHKKLKKKKKIQSMFYGRGLGGFGCFGGLIPRPPAEDEPAGSPEAPGESEGPPSSSPSPGGGVPSGGISVGPGGGM